MAINLVTLADPTSPAAEAYRRLRVNLMAPDRDAPLRALLVVAAGPDADKASTVANLAVTFARVGKQVILVDCDLRHPAQHTLFGLDNSTGVTTVVGAPLPPNAGGPGSPQATEARGPDSPQGWGAGGDSLPLQATELSNLRVLTSGPSVEVPSDLLASPAMAGLVARLRDEADVVLFDAPPVVLATDAAELAIQVDGVLLTVSAGHTKRADAQQAKNLLTKVGARLVGAALVNAPVDAELRKYLTA